MDFWLPLKITSPFRPPQEFLSGVAAVNSLDQEIRAAKRLCSFGTDKKLVVSILWPRCKR